MPLKLDKSKRTPAFWMAAFAAAMSLVAVGISLSGVATASQKVLVRKGDIAPGAVTAKSIAKGAVTTRSSRMARSPRGSWEPAR